MHYLFMNQNVWKFYFLCPTLSQNPIFPSSPSHSFLKTFNWSQDRLKKPTTFLAVPSKFVLYFQIVKIQTTVAVSIMTTELEFVHV